MTFKKPVSVLVVIHTPTLDILLLERAQRPGFWQSVTGSQEDGEPLLETARREVAEETGIITPAQSGLPLLQNLVGIAATGFRVDTAISGIAAVQSVLSASLGTWNWLGLVALGVGVMLGMNAVLPGRNNYF